MDSKTKSVDFASSVKSEEPCAGKPFGIHDDIANFVFVFSIIRVTRLQPMEGGCFVSTVNQRSWLAFICGSTRRRNNM